MAFTNFYIQTTGSDLNAGSTTANAAVFSSLTGNWDGTSIFTPTDSSTPASSVSVGDWASIYANGATVTAYVAQVTAVAAGINGAITLSTTNKMGTVPSAGTGTRNFKSGGAWASPSPIMNTALGNNVAVPVPVKVNIKAGTYTRTASETCQFKGSISNAMWIDGYNTTPGDLDSDTTNSLAKPIISYNAGFSWTFGADYQAISNISFLGNVSAAVVNAPNGNDFRMWRCRIENTSSNAAAVALSSTVAYSLIAYCWFKTPATATSNGVVRCTSGATIYGCVIIGGGKAGIELSAGSGANHVNNCVIQGAVVGILISNANAHNIIINNTIQNCSSDGIQFLGGASAAVAVFGNIISTAGGVGIKQTGTGLTGALVACNDTYNVTGGATSGLDDIGARYAQTESADPMTSTTDPTLKAGANARSNGFPGVFENLTTIDYASIGAVQVTGGAAGGGVKSYV